MSSNAIESERPARGSIVIRRLQPTDPARIAQAFAAQGWTKPADKYERYLEELRQGSRDVLVAEYEGGFAGYLTVVWESAYPPFREGGIPEIADFNVLIHCRRRGIGTALTDEAEARIEERSPVAGISVGLTADYGAAQILYVRRGYVPDGRGIWDGNRWLEWGNRIRVDDELVLLLKKQLR